MNASGFLKTFAVAAVVLAASSATANAQASYTVCKDGTTWLVRGYGVCGQHGGVDPKRSELARRTLNPNLPRDVERARRQEFEQRMKYELHVLHERQKAERDALNERQRNERLALESQKKAYEANQKNAHRTEEANRQAVKRAEEARKHAVKENEKEIKKAQKIARKP